MPIKDPDTHGAVAYGTGPNPYTIDVTPDPNFMRLSTKNTPAYANLYSLHFFGESFLKVRTNFTLNTGDISNVICSLKQPTSKLWNIKWTGVPVVDKFVCESGKKFYSLAVDMVISCQPYTRGDFYFDWDINFTTPFLKVWNFVAQTVIEITTAPYINLSMEPWITTYGDSQNHERRLKRAIRSTTSQPFAASSDDYTDDVSKPHPPSLYPIIPTAPKLDDDDTKPKSSLLKRILKRGGNSKGSF